jgi:uncharacterized protein (TIRG00374 family)
LFNIAIFAVSIWFLWSVLRDTGFETVGRRLLEATPWLVAVTAAASVVRYMLLGLRWEILVRTEAPMGYRPILSILMAGNFLQLVAPGLRVAGPVLRAFYLSKETGRPRARFYGTIVADQTANFSIFVVAMAVSGVLTAATGFEQSVAAGLGMFAALAGGLYLAKRHLERIRDGEPTILEKVLRFVLHVRRPKPSPGAGHMTLGERLVAWWDHLLEALIESMVGAGTWWRAIGVSAALFMVLAFSMKTSFAAVGTEITMAQAAFAVSAAAFVQIMAAAPGGPGITEASLVIIFLTLGLDPASAAAGSFLSRLINYAVLVPWGGACFWRLQRKYGTATANNSRERSGPSASAAPSRSAGADAAATEDATPATSA